MKVEVSSLGEELCTCPHLATATHEGLGCLHYLHTQRLTSFLNLILSMLAGEVGLAQILPKLHYLP